MSYLDFDRLDALDPHAFQTQRPYPWVNPHGLLTPTGYQRLVESLPAVSQFTRLFGVKRAHGQQSHDRYGLEYRPGLQLAPAWQDFIDELAGSAYRRFICRMFGVRAVELRFHWHYTPRGCSVSPHCDAKHKLGSHIFYWNPEWNPAWGGETLILDDGGRFARSSAPGLKTLINASCPRPRVIAACCFSAETTRGTVCAPWSVQTVSCGKSLSLSSTAIRL